MSKKIDAIVSDADSEIMSMTRELSDTDYVDALEQIISNLQTAVDVKREEMKS
jgi:ribosomal protein L20A (L18A)